MDAWNAFHRLFHALSNYQGHAVFAEVLEPWLSEHNDAREWLLLLGQREGNPVPPIEVEESWTLYALARGLDLLLREEVPISLEEYAAFAEALGMTVLKPQQFSPFYHEVVRVERAASPFSPVAIVEFEWPCVMLGNMMVSRAGVRVSAGAQLLVAGIADASTLYWTYLRSNRPHQDLSHGWGRNSQWRTEFRRDFVVGDTFYFNVDGKKDLASDDDDDDDESGLTHGERVELVTHRCFVRCGKPHDDLWPYDDRLVQRASPASGEVGITRKNSLFSRLFSRAG
ncbi:hypothetical protein ACN9MU_25085 [Pseudoduganella sp. R-32]|uniref:hypothetical protein n=1 Tax=Pseudoduganella sp. R-32 TaxID=3404061 RepID=UPI003CF44655